MGNEQLTILCLLLDGVDDTLSNIFRFNPLFMDIYIVTSYVITGDL